MVMGMGENGNRVVGKMGMGDTGTLLIRGSSRLWHRHVVGRALCGGHRLGVVLGYTQMQSRVDLFHDNNRV